MIKIRIDHNENLKVLGQTLKLALAAYYNYKLHIKRIVGRSTNAALTGTTAIYGVVLTSEKLASKVNLARLLLVFE